MEKIGFIGLGIMGLPMARNLVKAGFNLVVVSGHAKAAVEELQKGGAVVVRSPREVAAESELVVTCLPDTPDVWDAVAGPNGLLDGAKKGLIITDHSTTIAIVSKVLCGIKTDSSGLSLSAAVIA